MSKLDEWEQNKRDMGLVEGYARKQSAPFALPADPFEQRKRDMGLVPGYARKQSAPFTPPPDLFEQRKRDMGLVPGHPRKQSAPFAPPPDPFEQRKRDAGLVPGYPRLSSIAAEAGHGSAAVFPASQTTPDALGTMLAQPWGAAAASQARALGVNPTVLALTAQVESNFHNVTKSKQAQTGAGAIGVFQMQKEAFIEGMEEVRRTNRTLYDHLTHDPIMGRIKPDVESAAATGYILHLALELQKRGIQSPNFLDIRGAYNFGLDNGYNIANSGDRILMRDILKSQNIMDENGIRRDETVGEWKSNFISKYGEIARESVLLGRKV